MYLIFHLSEGYFLKMFIFSYNVLLYCKQVSRPDLGLIQPLVLWAAGTGAKLLSAYSTEVCLTLAAISWILCVTWNRHSVQFHILFSRYNECIFFLAAGKICSAQIIMRLREVMIDMYIWACIAQHGTHCEVLKYCKFIAGNKWRR